MLSYCFLNVLIHIIDLLEHIHVANILNIKTSFNILEHKNLT